ncbi:IclR family transcriptional regulator [Microtetraspora sp. NBRC 13810]|uniref:IclR family transcriptional regulator n=1 Tax=Microtetraspora sp. NBRC 13810 TaxID=3030990 RepID=UPI0024A13428|nr:IclR family transcriptional regulator [Microtetraspora sp. NBRC 13810]GLW06423.1 IclR family transcriptional regulator [Microtetraspora sp. NBRC 13810]
MSNNSGEGGFSSVDNALRLLELIGERQVLRVADAADLLGVARSTAHRLLAALRKRGFVLQDKPNGAYRPGPVLNEIGLAAIGRIDLRRVARPVLEELREQTRETVSLSLLEGRNIRFVDCVESTRAVRVGNRTGIVLPAHCTAGGKAILAALPPVELDRRYRGHELDTRTPSSIGDWEVLRNELEAVRGDGYALNVEEGEEGISAVAVALRDITGAPLAAVAVVVPSSRMPTAEAGRALAPAVLRAAESVQQLLGAEL